MASFFATMRIYSGDLTQDQLYGSWAGALAYQFMPSTYERLAVDFDGDGRRDLVSKQRMLWLQQQTFKANRLANRIAMGL